MSKEKKKLAGKEIDEKIEALRIETGDKTEELFNLIYEGHPLDISVPGALGLLLAEVCILACKKAPSISAAEEMVRMKTDHYFESLHKFVEEREKARSKLKKAAKK